MRRRSRCHRKAVLRWWGQCTTPLRCCFPRLHRRAPLSPTGLARRPARRPRHRRVAVSGRGVADTPRLMPPDPVCPRVDSVMPRADVQRLGAARTGRPALRVLSGDSGTPKKGACWFIRSPSRPTACAGACWRSGWLHQTQHPAGPAQLGDPTRTRRRLRCRSARPLQGLTVRFPQHPRGIRAPTARGHAHGTPPCVADIPACER